MKSVIKILITIFLLLLTILLGGEGLLKILECVFQSVVDFTQPEVTTEVVHSTRSPLKFHGEPVITMDQESFEAKSYDDFVAKLNGVGITVPEAFSRRAMDAKQKSHVSKRLLISPLDAPSLISLWSHLAQQKAKMSYLKVVTSKEKDGVMVKCSQMSAEVGVIARDIFQCSTICKQWGITQKTKGTIAKPRGLTSEEIHQIRTNLSNAIKSDPRFTSVSGEKLQSEFMKSKKGWFG